MSSPIRELADAAVTEVLVSPDMKHAQVRLHSDDLKQRQETIKRTGWRPPLPSPPIG